MSVRRDDKSGRWFFRVRVRFPDGTREQVFGTPGVAGPYHDLPNTKVGATKAEHRAISAAITGKPLVAATAMEAPNEETSPKTLCANVTETVSLFQKEVRGELERRHDARDAQEEGAFRGSRRTA